MQQRLTLFSALGLCLLSFEARCRNGLSADEKIRRQMAWEEAFGEIMLWGLHPSTAQFVVGTKGGSMLRPQRVM